MCAARRGRRTIISTGLPLLDEVTGGLREGTLWWVTGASGTGSSTFVAQLASAAADDGARTLVVSCLDDASMVADRSGGADVTVLAVPADEPLDVHVRVGTTGWRVIVVDAFDVGAGPDLATPLARLRGIAQRRRCTIICTGHSVLAPDGSVPAPWVRLTDVVVTLDRPDLKDPSDRPAEVMARVLRNRVGLRADVPLAMSERRRRFVELAP